MDYSRLRELLFLMYVNSPPNIQGRIEVWCDILVQLQLWGGFTGRTNVAIIEDFLLKQLKQAQIDMPVRYADWAECIKTLE